MKTWFILIWFASGTMCNEKGVMTPCEYRKVFESKTEVVEYIKDELASDFGYGRQDWNKTRGYILWEVQGSSIPVVAKRTVVSDLEQ